MSEDFTRGYDNFAEIMASDETRAIIEDAVRDGLLVTDKRTPLERARDRTGTKGPQFLDLRGTSLQEFAEGRADLPPTPDFISDASEGHRLYRRGILKRIERIMLSSKPWNQVLEEVAFELGTAGPREVEKLRATQR